MKATGADGVGVNDRQVVSRLQRLRGFGLRGRIVGAVLVTTVVTLAVAAIVLLPQLDDALRRASKEALSADMTRARPEIRNLGSVRYELLPILTLDRLQGTPQYRAAHRAEGELTYDLSRLRQELGTEAVALVGYLDSSDHGSEVTGVTAATLGMDNDGPGGAENSGGGAGPSSGTGAGFTFGQGISNSNDLGDVMTAAQQRHVTYTPYISFGKLDGQPVIRAAVKLPNGSVLAVRKSIDEIPAAAKAVARSFEVAALAGLLLTGLLAIPLAATLARRLQRLREAAQRVAEEGTGAVVPTDRARDEVGDLARSFAIMQRRLAHQEEARRAFVATASHELRTPLASLEGMLELVADDLSAPGPDLGEANVLLERARAQSRRLSRLAADLLDLSRIDAEVPLRSEPVELGELARAVLAEFEMLMDEHGVRSSIGGVRDAVWVRADPGKIAQILRILLDNALRIAPRDSEVAIALAPTGLSVIDHGPGVAREERELIFERFKRGGSTGGEAGFGLGLAIGRELARRMDGDLTLADAPSGATFRLTLPAAAAPAHADQDESLPAGRS